MDGTAIGLIAGGGATALTAVGTMLLRLLPERRNLTVDAAQKAVQAMSDTMDDVISQLGHARETANTLARELQLARDELGKARGEVLELTQLLDHERTRVGELEHQVDELQTRLAS